MALKKVTKLPDTALAEWYLIDGGDLNDYRRGQATLVKTFKAEIPTAQAGPQVTPLAARPLSPPANDPSHPTATWYIHSCSGPDVAKFDTATPYTLQSDEYAEDLDRQVTWFFEDDKANGAGGGLVGVPTKDLTITKGDGQAVTKIERKRP